MAYRQRSRAAGIGSCTLKRVQGIDIRGWKPLRNRFVLIQARRD
jgi:hypothetical protein